MSFTYKYISVMLKMSIVLLFLSLPSVVMAQNGSFQSVAERAAAAGIEQHRIDQIQERALDRGINESMLARLLNPAADLAENNFPSEYVMQKIMEGLAKGVPGGRMLPVIEAIHRQTPQAVAIVEQWTGRAEVASFMKLMGDRQPQFRQELVNAGLKSLTHQVAPETIESVLNELGKATVLDKTSPQAVAAAVGILPDLPAAVLEEKGVHGIIARAIEGGFSAADIQKLPGAINVAGRQSKLPASSVLQGMSKQLGNGTPANIILQNLFNGNINAGPPDGVPGRPGGKPDGRGGNNGQGNGNGGG